MVKTNQIVQAGYIVDDIDAAMADWMRVAEIGPFFVMRDVSPDEVKFWGQPGDLVADVAFCQAGPLQIELIQPKITNRAFHTLGYHHQAYWPDDFDAEIARFAAMDVEVALFGRSGEVRFAYFDTRGLIGCYTEIVEHNDGFVAMNRHMAEASVNWDGSDPIRPIPAI